MSRARGEKAPLSPTSGLNARVRELVAQGRDIAVLTAGEPSGGPPEHVREAAARAARSRDGHGYGPIAGLAELRDQVAASTPVLDGEHLDRENVVVTGGAKQAVFATFLALLELGDAVLVPTPVWPTYAHAVRLAGGRSITVPTTPEMGHLPSAELLEEHGDPAARFLMICSPSNPTGAVMTSELLSEVGAWCAEHQVTVVLDQIYGQLCWTNVDRPPRRVLREAGAEVIVIDGVSKTYAMTGWRIGWLVAPAPMAAAVTAVISHTSNHPNRIAQVAALAALQGDQRSVEELRGHLRDNRERLGKILSAVPDILRYQEPQGTFYAFPSLAPLLARKPELSDAATVARLMLDQAGVAVIPASPFGAPDHVRISFVEPADKLERALARMVGFLSDIK